MFLFRKLVLFFLTIQSFSLFSTPPNPFDSKYDWMDLLIEENFLPYKDGIFIETIENTPPHAWIVRLKVIDGKVYAPKGAGLQMLQYLSDTYGLPDLDCLYWQQDGLSDDYPGGAPILCASKIKGVSQGIYFVDWYTKILISKNWNEKIEPILQTVKWEERKDQLIWRGWTSDGWYTTENWASHRRAKLCNLSLQFPELIDARFNNICHVTTSQIEELREIVPYGSTMSIEEHIQYKYQLICDGMFSTFAGDKWRFFSESVNFMHESEFGHWFYGGLIPWVHYVPVKSDLSDLVDKLLYMKANPDLGRQIAVNGRQFALDYLTPEKIAVYCYKVLLKYASLQKFSPKMEKGSE